MTPTRTIRRALVAAVGLAAAAGAATPAAHAATPRPNAPIVVPRQILALAPPGSPVRRARRAARVDWRTAPRLNVVLHAGHGRARTGRQPRARAAAYGLHYLNPGAVCAGGGVTLDYRDAWYSSLHGDVELMMVQDYAFSFDGSSWRQYAQDGVAFAWSQFQLGTGWHAVGPGGTVVAADLGDGVRFATAAGAKIKLVQGIAWLDRAGTVLAVDYRALDHRNPGWFDFAAHPFCQY